MGTKRAKLFQIGASQAVRLPKEFAFPDDHTEVLIRREGTTIILERVNTWPAEFVACLGSWDEEIARPPRRGMRDVRVKRK